MYYWKVQVSCLIESLARCTVQSALIAGTSAKFHSNLILADQFIVEIVGQKEDEQEDTVTRRSHERVVTIFFYSKKFLKLQSVFFSLKVPEFWFR